MNDRTLQVRNVLDEISVLAHLFFASMYVPWIRIAVNDIVTIKLNRKSKMSRTRMLRANAKRHEPIVICSIFL
jgi:Na+-transporting methylmalonyl-CoA/oxaloacetate decarboxylase beta subunit